MIKLQTNLHHRISVHSDKRFSFMALELCITSTEQLRQLT